MVMNSGANCSLHPNCHYKLVVGYFYLKFFWFHIQANNDEIKKAIDGFTREAALNY